MSNFVHMINITYKNSGILHIFWTILIYFVQYISHFDTILCEFDHIL